VSRSEWSQSYGCGFDAIDTGKMKSFKKGPTLLQLKGIKKGACLLFECDSGKDGARSSDIEIISRIQQRPMKLEPARLPDPGALGIGENNHQTSTTALKWL